MIHKSKIENYSGTMEELATEIGNLRYDALAMFLDLLAKKIESDGQKDAARKRFKLSSNLLQSAKNIQESKLYIDKAWDICKPFT